ncbi:uncharacterized protein LOC142588985 isoform X4 [Dermacentor variabilis]|uniref:uncharacterized protein LOC142559735 isoform X5 n=1 Tax=Dermacentor variabilis TaxID=34621 RepID=UPI003F5B41D5
MEASSRKFLFEQPFCHRHQHVVRKASLFIQSHNSPPAMLRTPRQSHTKFNVVIARAVVFSEAGTHAWRPAEHKLQHVWRARETARAAGVLD